MMTIPELERVRTVPADTLPQRTQRPPCTEQHIMTRAGPACVFLKFVETQEKMKSFSKIIFVC